MRILVTRAKGDSVALAAELQAIGCETSVAPLIEIAFEDIDPAVFKGSAGIVATSRNALRALAHSNALEEARGLPLYAVGAATAGLARELGFTRIVTGPGEAAGLAPLIAASPAAERTPLIHLTGDRLAYDLEADLARLGIRLDKVPAYRAIAASALPVDVTDQLRRGALDAVILMSPRSAAIWSELVKAARLSPLAITRLTYVCLSAAVARALSLALADFEGKALQIEVAERPGNVEILALVKKLAAHSGQE